MVCGTGIFLLSVDAQDTIVETEYNGLVYSPMFYDGMDVESDTFPTMLRNVFGDSVEFYWDLWIYTVPWSKYPPQGALSQKVMVNIEEVIRRWEVRRKTVKQNFNNL
jgi:hypothetical protein